MYGFHWMAVHYIVWILHSIVGIYHILFVHWSINEHLGYLRFWLLWIMLLWTFVYKFLCGRVFLFLLNIYLGMKLLGYVNAVFNLVRNYQTVFPSDWTISHFHHMVCLLKIALWVNVWEVIAVSFKLCQKSSLTHNHNITHSAIFEVTDTCVYGNIKYTKSSMCIYILFIYNIKFIVKSKTLGEYYVGNPHGLGRGVGGKSKGLAGTG